MKDRMQCPICGGDNANCDCVYNLPADWAWEGIINPEPEEPHHLPPEEPEPSNDNEDPTP